MRALIISANGFEDSELRVPRDQLRSDGIPTDVASPKRGKIRGKHGYVVEVDLLVDEIDVVAYDLLILPGGKTPTKLNGSDGVGGGADVCRRRETRRCDLPWSTDTDFCRCAARAYGDVLSISYGGNDAIRGALCG